MTAFELIARVFLFGAWLHAMSDPEKGKAYGLVAIAAAILAHADRRTP